MKKVIKSGLSLIMAAVMCLALLPMTALAAGLPTTKLDAPTNLSAVIQGIDYKNYGREIIEITADIPDSIKPYLYENYSYVPTLDDGRQYTLLMEVDWSVNSLDDWKCTGELNYVNEEIWINHPTSYAFVMPGLKGKTTITHTLQFLNGGIEEYNAYPEFYISYRDKEGNRNEAGGRFKDGITINLRARYSLLVYSGDPYLVFYSDWTPVFQAVRADDNTETQKPTEPTTPTEKPSTWAEEQVNAAISNNLVPKDLQAKYTQATTRAEFAALAVTLYEQVTGKTITERVTFSDTTDINVQKAAAIGVVNGVGDNKFDPNAGLTREQAATMLSRLANATGKPLTQQAATFADNASVSTWAFEAVGQMQVSGIMGGVGNNTFDPKGAYTREQSIITIMRLFDVLKGNTGNANNPPPSGNTISGKYQWSGDAGDAGNCTIIAEFRSDGTVTFTETQHDNNDKVYTYNGTYKADNGKIYVSADVPAFSGDIEVDNAKGTITLITFGDVNNAKVFEKVK